MISRRALILTGSVSLVAALAAPSFATDPATGLVFTHNGAAIRGADPVAYFTEGKPVYGSQEFSHVYDGATWLFASAANRDAFAADPAAYAPQYGGNCAWAVAQGYTASTVPEAWAIVDGKLYLNYSRGVQRRWNRDVPGHISSADANWPKIVADNS